MSHGVDDDDDDEEIDSLSFLFNGRTAWRQEHTPHTRWRWREPIYGNLYSLKKKSFRKHNNWKHKDRLELKRNQSGFSKSTCGYSTSKLSNTLSV